MAGALRMVSLSRGRDPRDFCLLRFRRGGTAACDGARAQLGIPKVLIPARPGMTNALGCVVADLRRHYVRTVNLALDELPPTLIAEVLAEQPRAAARHDGEAADIVAIEELFTAGLQFKGQSHQLTVSATDPTDFRRQAARGLRGRLLARFRMRLPEARAMLVSLNTGVVGRRQRIDLRALASKRDARARPRPHRPAGLVRRRLASRRRSSPRSAGARHASPARHCRADRHHRHGRARAAVEVDRSAT